MNLQKSLHRVYDLLHPRTYDLKEFVIKDGKKHPFALIIPGGAYAMVCSYVEGAPFAKKLNELGISAFVLYYRCGQNAHYPAPQQDVAKALATIFSRKDELNLITDDYSIWGASAGGHLAASFGTKHLGYAKYQLPRPCALVLTYPVITMEDHTHPLSRKNLLGDAPTREEIEQYSIEQQIDPDYPPTFLWCGANDIVVPPQNSREMAKALQEKGVTHEFCEYNDAPHGAGLGEGMPCEGWFYKAVSFWLSQRSRTLSEERK